LSVLLDLRSCRERSSLANPTAIDFKEQIQDLSDRIESTRDTHAGFGIIYYWDPENGSDLNDGLLRTTGVKTFAAAHALVSPGDSIIGIAPSSGFVADQINITKEDIHVRCPGDIFWLKPSTDVVPIILNNANHSSVRGLRISKATAGSANGINIINSDRVLIDGRARSFCAFKALDFIGPRSLVFIDNFYDRPAYQDVLNVYEEIDGAHSLIVLRKK